MAIFFLACFKGFIHTRLTHVLDSSHHPAHHFHTYRFYFFHFPTLHHATVRPSPQSQRGQRYYAHAPNRGLADAQYCTIALSDITQHTAAAAFASCFPYLTI